ncbi:MAG: VWA domain-containing protein [Isosphaeraceae bacterium]
MKALGADPASRVAVAAFSGRGVLHYPDKNLGAVLDVVARLRPGSVQPGGTDLGAGLDAAMDAFRTDEHSRGVPSSSSRTGKTWPTAGDRGWSDWGGWGS